MQRRVQITTDLEDDIRKEMADLDQRLRSGQLDNRTNVSTGLLQRREALRWVLERAGCR